MCIVIDANAAHKLRGADPDGAPVLSWLLRGRGKLVVSKELLDELARTAIRPILVTLERAGKLIRANEARCGQLVEQLTASELPVSNDVHILALVVVTTCDVIFTHDQPLHRDLKNRAVVPHHCAIYQTADHRALLGECRC